MTENAITPDKWYDQYIESSVKQQYQMLLDIMQQPLSQDFLESTDMDDLLIAMSDELNSNNLIDEHLTLIQLVQQQQPKLYKKEFVYYDNFLATYYLYTKQHDLLKNALIRFKKYPANDLEQFWAVLNLLSFYEQSEIAVDLCQSIYKLVKNNSKLISGAEDELAWLIVTNLMEKAYQRNQQGEDIDWKKFNTELQKYGYGEDKDWLEDIKYALTNEFNKEQCLSRFKQKKLQGRAFNILSTTFYIYIKQEKQMSFVCSQAMWEAIFDFLGNRDLNFKQSANPNTFFKFSKKDLESYLAQKLSGFLSMRQAQAFATLWGITYLYDFLLSTGIIRDQVHSKIINITNQLKAELLEKFRNSWQLWRYDFINRWQPDSNSDSSELATQAQFFTDSFAHSEPLSDKPGEGKVESFFNEMAEKLGFDLEKIRSEYENSDESPIAAQKNTEIAKKIPSTKTKSKKKKSNLGLAAKLYNKRN